MDTTATITFAAAAPIIAIIMGIVLNALPTKLAVPSRTLPLVAVFLSALYGLVLYYGGTFTGSIAEFIVTAVTIGYAAAGIYQHGTEFSNISIQNPFVVTAPPPPPAPEVSQAQIDAAVARALQAAPASTTVVPSTSLGIAPLTVTAPPPTTTTAQPPV